ncbi:PTS sugar transporter subunit IIA [Cellulosilyticum ruminicola]|uniref:PTS sugar transporter subunit IIA n=1 Tax=Cellulosilyticum ruminicola TaxID=425254 RepID=UPI0006D13126|nr:glucose PTS transporter subunit IIA [Cellulosilyticum ruminicola]
MLNKSASIVMGAASSDIVSSTSWITIVFIAIIAIIAIIFIYKVIRSGKIEDKHVTRVMTEPIKKDEVAEGITPLGPKEEEREADEVIAMPVSGTLMYLSDVPDPIYAEQLKGEGFAVEPNEGNINSPVKGRIMEIAPTRHALTIETPAQRKVLVHIGVEAATLKGEGFICNVQVDQIVEIGEALFTIDLPKVKTKIPSVVTSVVFTNLKDYEKVIVKDTGYVKAGEVGLVAIEEKC